MNTVSEKIKVLRGLGTKEAMAEFLLVRGFVGARFAFDRCPISNYLSDGDDVRWEIVGSRGVAPYDPEIDDPGKVDSRPRLRIVVEGIVDEFVDSFDDNEFPELIGVCRQHCETVTG